MAESLGPHVRLEGLAISQLPLGGKGNEPSKPMGGDEKFNDGSGSAAPTPNVKAFVHDVLTEAIPFIDGVAPKSGGSQTWKTKGSPKHFPASEAPVHLYERTVAGNDIDQIQGMNKFSADRSDETWFCRKSVHANKADKGTATWQEFFTSFKEHHGESEKAFTPTVIGAREAIKWNAADVEVEVLGERWSNVTVVVEEMLHKIDPKPLKNRTFPVIQVAAELSGAQEFLIVSIPVNDFYKSPYAEYAKEKSLVIGAYVSVERVRVLPSNGNIEWIMATASDAKGSLPQVCGIHHDLMSILMLAKVDAEDGRSRCRCQGRTTIYESMVVRPRPRTCLPLQLRESGGAPES